ncbi:MAG TPA: pyridoxamine 5'-phosphate oxidase family protein [Methylomirabilota bacterium]|jgi:nitroimidazol reductase NimA-like FMN-containing flavoprotein (pyridoxamine 5'-phosphate oxidase superfamily)|nr:pyridoxamine 5'-phosphate oxidase family protein [Methylomirabilota bacterium]
MAQFTPTERTTLHRRPARGSYDRATVAAILDEGLYCHIGFVVDAQPYVLPTIHARVENQLYIHGSSASRMLRTLKTGAPICVTVTILDGLVLARSAFHHSMNYRSVVVLGTAHEATDPREKYDALKAIVEHVAPHRWDDVRWPNEQELKATSVLRLPLEEVSAKIRTGPPLDDEEDYQLSCWAGELPLRLTPQPPIADPRLSPGINAPAYIYDYRRLSSSQREYS